MAMKTYASAIAAAAAASAALLNQSNAYADGILPPNPSENQPSPAPPKVRNDHPRTTSAGFDPEALERGVEALDKISTSPHREKVSALCPFSLSMQPHHFLLRRFNLALIVQVFDVIKKQEETKQAELASKAAEFRLMKAQHETVS